MLVEGEGATTMLVEGKSKHSVTRGGARANQAVSRGEGANILLVEREEQIGC